MGTSLMIDICIRNETRQDHLVLSSIDVKELFLGLETIFFFLGKPCGAHFIDLKKGLHHSPGSLRCSGFITIITELFTTHALLEKRFMV
jgi:hypothetical protein